MWVCNATHSKRSSHATQGGLCHHRPAPDRALLGGDLRNALMGKSPTFIVAALKDPIGANLDRLQVIKGWLDKDGKTQGSTSRSRCRRKFPCSARSAPTRRRSGIPLAGNNKVLHMHKLLREPLLHFLLLGAALFGVFGVVGTRTSNESG